MGAFGLGRREPHPVFALDRRTISCGYDDLMIVGTDYVAAVDAALAPRRGQQPLD
jgi:hypothetical protein